MEVDKGSKQKSDFLTHCMAVHACLKSEFMEDEKYHNLMSWLKYRDVLKALATYRLGHAMPKCVLCHMWTKKVQISLRIRAVWSAPLFFGG